MASGGGTGVLGQGDTPAAVGVRGVAWDGTTAGSYGTAVMGVAGVHDKAQWPAGRASTAVMGYAPTGTAVYAQSSSGVALQASGKVVFSRSGKASVPANATYVDVAVPGGLAGSPLAFANLATYRSGVYVAAVTPSAATGKIRVRLNKVASTSASTAFAWQVLG